MKKKKEFEEVISFFGCFVCYELGMESIRTLESVIPTPTLDCVALARCRYCCSLWKVQQRDQEHTAVGPDHCATRSDRTDLLASFVDPTTTRNAVRRVEEETKSPSHPPSLLAAVITDYIVGLEPILHTRA